MNPQNLSVNKVYKKIFYNTFELVILIKWGVLFYDHLPNRSLLDPDTLHFWRQASCSSGK